MEYWLFLTLAGLIGLFAGLMSGIFGIGGGSVRTPLLNVIGIDLIFTFGINLLTIPFSSSIGAYSHRINLDKKIALYMIIGGSMGSAGGIFLAYLFSLSDFKLLLAIIYVIISFITVFGIYFYKLAPKVYSRLHPSPIIVTIGSFILNLITGMRGGSGGSLFSPFLKTIGVDVKRAIATSLFATIFTAFVAIIIYSWNSQILFVEGFIVMICSVLGARLGSLLSLKTKPKWLEFGLSLLVSLLSLLVIIKAVYW